MASNRVVFSGLDELRAELRALPAALAAEASTIIVETANGAAQTVRGVYEQHVVTGRLAKSVTVTQPGAGSFGVAMVVKVNDPIAWLFDNGSQARHWASGRGTGIMFDILGPRPPTHIFGRTMGRYRRAMYGALKNLIVEHGMTVSGEP